MIKINTGKIKAIEFTDHFTGVQLADFDSSVKAKRNQSVRSGIESDWDKGWKLTVWTSNPKIKAKAKVDGGQVLFITPKRAIAGKAPFAILVPSDDSEESDNE